MRRWILVAISVAILFVVIASWFLFDGARNLGGVVLLVGMAALGLFHFAVNCTQTCQTTREAERGLVQERTSRDLSTIPLQRPRRAAHFVGREEALDRLITNLQPGRVISLCGPGGIGKTALAAEAVWALAPTQEPPDRFPDGIVFYSFHGQPEVNLALEAICRAYGQEPRPTPRGAAVRALAEKHALLVLDGAEAADDLDAVLDTVLDVRNGCGVLVTSRRWEDAPGQRQDLDPLSPPSAVKLLQAWAGEKGVDQPVAERICRAAGWLPLAIRLAGCCLNHTGEEGAPYVRWLEKAPIDAGDQGERRRERVQRLVTYNLAQASTEARRALGVASLLAVAPFDQALVAAALNMEEEEIRHALGELVDCGLLIHTDGGWAVSHALVHSYARRRLSPDADVLVRQSRRATLPSKCSKDKKRG